MDKGSYGLVHPSAFKQGHKCCGGCCDVRRAVIIVNIINAFVSLFVIIELIFYDQLIESGKNVYSEDMQNSLEKMSDQVHHMEGALIGLMVVRLFGSLAGIYGGMTFSWPLVAASMGVYALVAAPDILMFGVVGGPLLDGLFAYPHYYLTRRSRRV
eukprot:CAMPEP_0194048950 /NCGR_PEP_ID=MMETSP0009_2-20130614/29105_1 /TAXON_ID=210454 /ORGANISM="Grammatophora oceanica, Strain CCMP 410" /LENGTH=155 /DNA_ID=CAMNT_0038694985 /DNA_START=87 /DNA_END=554 /DNA_ORIENTATION=+